MSKYPAIRSLSVAAFHRPGDISVDLVARPLWQVPKYSWLAHSISEMYAVTAPGSLVFMIVFTITGAITILFALITVTRTFRPGGRTAVVG